MVEGITYRWLVGPNDGYNVFVAQKEGIEARIIEVYFSTYINALWKYARKASHLRATVSRPFGGNGKPRAF